MSFRPARRWPAPLRPLLILDHHACRSRGGVAQQRALRVDRIPVARVGVGDDRQPCRGAHRPELVDGLAVAEEAEGGGHDVVGLLEASVDSPYPNAPRRLVDSLARAFVANPASVVFSMKPGYAWGWQSAYASSFIWGGRLEGTHGGPLITPDGELPATGRQVSFDVLEILEFNQEGLVVVNIPGADGMTLKGIARSIRSLALAARENRVGPDDLTGFTFSITNPGPFGSFMSAPIINVPNAAILSTDTVKKRPVVVEMPDGTDSIAIHHVGYLGLSWDHRVFDGSTAVLFLNRIKDNLETWDWEQELK